MKNILLVNDDGVFSDGILELANILKNNHKVTIVAPDRERSASSQSLTTHDPLRIIKINDFKYAVDGTPTDCVILATQIILKKKIDLIISGINNGQNMGEDIMYSGTVAAALEAMNLGFPSIAVSLASHKRGNFQDSAEIVNNLLKNNLFSILKKDTVLNINIPPLPLTKIKGIRVTRLGHRTYQDFIQERIDPRGRKYYWIGGKSADWSESGDTDFDAIKAGYVSITPITKDMTQYSYFSQIDNWIHKYK